MSFGNDMKKEMLELRVQRQQLADIVGVSEPMITHFITGRRRPTAEIARAIQFVFHFITAQQQQTGRFPLSKENIRLLRRGIHEMEASVRIKANKVETEEHRHELQAH